MRRTEELIRQLAMDVKPVRSHAIGWRIAVGILGGGAISLLLLIAVFGIRPDLHEALRDFSFWVRSLYTVSLGIGAMFVTASLARPDNVRAHWLWLLVVPVLLLTGIGIGEMANVPLSNWQSLWLGRSWKVCPWRILMLSAPIFAGMLWAFRRFAPTRLPLAGAAAGLTAGAWSATLYGLYCQEESAIFVLTWFTLGMLLAALLGAFLGRRLLRW
ncbi:MAG TPA: DUF1109 domain-containing protein [Steroidobacteraceae bacterium]|jgi:hypothetical protein